MAILETGDSNGHVSERARSDLRSDPEGGANVCKHIAEYNLLFYGTERKDMSGAADVGSANCFLVAADAAPHLSAQSVVDGGQLAWLFHFVLVSSQSAASSPPAASRTAVSPGSAP